MAGKEITLREMQTIELELLLAIRDVCEKHGLRYYLDGGTLLGAMCYEGFIPWDDDIDLKMPRPDYERLLSLQQEFPAHMRLDIPRRGHCAYTMTKLVDERTILVEQTECGEKTTGVYVDIFPMDGHPENAARREKHIRKLQRLNSLFHASQTNFSKMKGWKRRVYRLLYTPWGLYCLMTKLAAGVDYDSASRVGLLVEGNPEKECFPKDWLEPKKMLEFEGYVFPVPGEYRRHMEHFYGAHVTKPEHYHNLPRYPDAHHHRVYWKE